MGQTFLDLKGRDKDMIKEKNIGIEWLENRKKKGTNM